MGTILESVNNLSEKLGVEEREQTIKDQLDLCVERLGGEGYSVDIAESANKFADKEDGTATFMTKTITENNTYNAADDGVSGYSSVTVNVPMTYNMIKLPLFNKGFDAAYNRVVNGAILTSSDGVYILPPPFTPEGAPLMGSSPTLILADPLVSMSDAFGYNESCIMFTPDEHLDFTLPPFSNPYDDIIGIDTIVPGDGKTYELNASRVNGELVRTVKKYDVDFVITIE